MLSRSFARFTSSLTASRKSLVLPNVLDFSICFLEGPPNSFVTIGNCCGAHVVC